MEKCQAYKVGYSVDALDDLREIYAYIANELLVPETATAQADKEKSTKSSIPSYLFEFMIPSISRPP